MATEQNPVPPRRDGRSGGALDAETQQQVAELNLQGIEALRLALAVVGAYVSADAIAGPPGPASHAGTPSARRPGVSRRALAGPGDGPAGRARHRGATDRTATRAARVALARSGLAAAIAAPLRCDGSPLPDALRLLGAEWLALDDEARHRMAACPFLLFELDFAGLLGAAAALPRFVQESRGVPGAPSAVASPFVGAEGRSFARLLFHYAWHLVRSAPTSAAFVLGAPPAALEPLRALGLARVESIAASAGGWVRLRWDQEPLIWIDWLAAARAADPAALWSSQLRGLQRIAGACREVPSSA